MSIVLSNLVKRFGSNLVVNDVSLDVSDGELFVLLGGSGSGKSTILRMIAGLIQPDAGRIELNGRDVTYLPPQNRNTGFVFQNYSIFRHMTVAQNVEFGLRIRQAPPAERAQRSAELLDLVGLAGLGSRYADQLSGGQQQRVALARALAYEPAVLLLDEPFGALDVKIRAQLRRSLRAIQEQLKVTTILVTHDQEEAFELADRIGVIEQGRLVEVGRPEELYHRPHTEFTATFIGGGNVLVGRVEDNHVCLGAVRLPMPPDAPTHDEGAPVRILFRPETVFLQAEPFAPEQGVTTLGKGRVRERTFSGSWQRILLAVDELRGARPLAPQPIYGQRTARIEAVLPSDADATQQLAPEREMWIGLKHYHVLSPAGLKVLIYADQASDNAAIEFGCHLAQAARGPVTLLALAPSADGVAGAREWLEMLRYRWLEQMPQLTTHVRHGSAEEILRHAREGNYELVVMRQPDGAAGAGGLDATARQLLLQAGISVLLVQAPRVKINRVLICTAAGEPGKSDVRFGGRVARRTGAQATVLHVASPEASGGQKARVERHLARAQASLDALGVRSAVKVEVGTATEAILQEAEGGDYDLIVIGAPAPPAHQQILWTDLASRIVAGTTRPVLIVPMLE